MTTFLLKGHKAKEVFHGSHAVTGTLEIRGNWSMSGPQPVGDGGVPECVAQVFRSMPAVTRIALQGENGAGSVWQRVED
jgi:hypothetical protein